MHPNGVDVHLRASATTAPSSEKQDQDDDEDQGSQADVHESLRSRCASTDGLPRARQNSPAIFVRHGVNPYATGKFRSKCPPETRANSQRARERSSATMRSAVSAASKPLLSTS